MGVFDLQANYGLEVRSTGRNDPAMRFRIFRRVQLSNNAWGDAGDYSFGSGPDFGPNAQPLEYKVEIVELFHDAPPVTFLGVQSDDGKLVRLSLGNYTVLCKRIPPPG